MTDATPNFCFNCGASLPQGANFCPGCGTAIQAAAAPPAPAAPVESVPEKTPSGERRQVTILFIDLSGYTRLSNELDAEQVHALLERFFGKVDSEIKNFGGAVMNGGRRLIATKINFDHVVFLAHREFPI